jgi:uncharacterized protein with PIN domain
MKFIITDELGKLARWLRILGFDTQIEKDRSKLVIKSLRDKRIILTRDSKMSRFTGTRMVHIKSDFVEEQLTQLASELGFDIDKERLFSLCVICNKNLECAAKASVKNKVPAYVYGIQKSFMKCPECGRIYWQGTHWALVNEFLNKVHRTS